MSSFFDQTVVGQALLDHNVMSRDRDRVVAWWLMSKPGETMILARHGGDYLRVSHDGTVTVQEPPSRGAAAAAHFLVVDLDTDGL